jgi:beta-N-acetylhexosaminidase
VLLTATLALCAASGCGSAALAPRPVARALTAQVSAARPAARPRVPLVARLSPLQLLGQRIIYAYSGSTPPASLLARVRAGEAAGVIFFAPNVADARAFRAAVHELRTANAQSPVHVPLLLMTDQEGGLVRRLPGPPALSEKQIGTSPNAGRLASAAGAQAGATLRGAGLDVNLTPVLDVYRTPGNFIDAAERSYSSNPAVVATLGANFIKAQQDVGVAATAKHFPGLGAAAASQDTDNGPVTLAVPLATLRGDDEAPYRAAIAAGVKLVMTSWAVYPALDPRHPAGLSSKVIAGELRRRLGFHGVVITDALAAGALGAFGTIGHRAVLAAGAGVDLLLCAEPDPDENTPTDGGLALQSLVTALAGGRLSRTAAEQSAARVMKLRSGL